MLLLALLVLTPCHTASAQSLLQGQQQQQTVSLQRQQQQQREDSAPATVLQRWQQQKRPQQRQRQQQGQQPALLKGTAQAHRDLVQLLLQASTPWTLIPLALTCPGQEVVVLTDCCPHKQ
jgi:hypothetical protein